MAGIRSILICIAACASFACGSAPQTDPSQTANPQTLIEVEPAINICPIFDGALIIPLDIAPSVLAHIIVNATDPDGSDATLVYAWSASSGDFSDPKSPATTYRCSELGPQVLRLTAEDVHACRSTTALDVTCIPE